MWHLVLSQDRACAQLFKSRSMQAWLIAGKEGGWRQPLGPALQNSLQLNPMAAVLWVHRDFYKWAIGVLTEAPKINCSFWHLSLCSCVTHPEGLHCWEVSWSSSDQESWPEVTGGLRRGMQSLYAGKKVNISCCTENIIVGCRNTLCLYHGLWMWCWAHHPPSAFQQWPQAVLYVRGHCGGQN